MDANILIGDLIIFQPLIIEATKENPFKLEERKHPVDFVTPIQESLAFSHEIPEGLVVDFIPANANIRLGRDASYVFGAKVEGNKIEFSSFLNIRKTMFLPDEYQAIKEFFDKIVEKQAEQVILKKSS